MVISVLKGFRWTWNILFPALIVYGLWAAFYPFEPIKFLEPMSIVEVNNGIVKYKSHFVKTVDAPGTISVHFVDSFGNTFIPKLENSGKRNNPANKEISILPAVDVSAWKPKGDVTMYWSVEHPINLPLYGERRIITRQTVTDICIKESCD